MADSGGDARPDVDGGTGRVKETSGCATASSRPLIWQHVLLLGLLALRSRRCGLWKDVSSRFIV
jgi:hypothetical protein